MTVSDEGVSDLIGEEIHEIPLLDDDIIDAMRHISGYLDVSTEDFRLLYHFAHTHAMERMVGRLRAESMLRSDLTPLTADLPLDQAARLIVQSGYKGLPVVNDEHQVIGILTETDFLRRLKADTFLELMLRLLDDSGNFSHRCHESRVSDAMTSSMIIIGLDAGFQEIMAAFARHDGRSMPVVDSHGHYCGMLLRKDFLAALNCDHLPCVF